MDTLQMTAKDAINYVSDTYGISSMYKLAKELSDDKLTVTTTQIQNYLTKNVKMSRKVADRFQEVYDIIITDVYDRGAIRRNYTKTI